ncbi:hypothetical protein ACJX0J_006862, partial [Zea mays]
VEAYHEPNIEKIYMKLMVKKEKYYTISDQNFVQAVVKNEGKSTDFELGHNIHLEIYNIPINKESIDDLGTIIIFQFFDTHESFKEGLAMLLYIVACAIPLCWSVACLNLYFMDEST